ncbi:MAG: hypothetical protein HY835_04245 [Anaerolineae bacterium]|nr:hypothetical protein [Anaerolineae bacterium]
MGTVSLIVGSYLFTMFTVVKLLLMFKRFPNFKQQLIGLVTLPNSAERRDEWLVFFAQVMALSWVILGIAINVFSLETYLAGLPLGGLIRLIILFSPVLLFILILRLVSKGK